MANLSQRSVRSGAATLIARALQLLLQLVMAMVLARLLTPAEVATASYGAAVRHALAATTTLVSIADLTSHPDASFEATVYPLAIVARRAEAPAGHIVRTSLARGRGGGVAQSRLRGGEPWMLTGGRAQRVLTRLARAFPPLHDSVSCHLGLKTGANSLFLNPPDSVEAYLTRHAVRGRDIVPFQATSRARLLYTHGADGEPLPTLPPGAAAYLAPHIETLRHRADFTGGSPWTLFRTRAATSPYRVVWADLARDLTAVALTDPGDRDLVPLNSCYVAVAESKPIAERIAGWLNCSWIRIAARIGAVPAAGGFARFAGNTIGRLPLPDAVLRDPRLGALAIAARGGEAVQHALDDLTAAHLGLSASDRDALRSLVVARC